MKDTIWSFSLGNIVILVKFSSFTALKDSVQLIEFY